MRNALFNLCPDAGSKNRLRQFRSNLKKDRDERNFDHHVDYLLRAYLKPSWRREYSRTRRYLHNLRSSKDGKLFSQGVKEYSKLLASGRAFAEPNYAPFSWNRYYKAAKEDFISEFSKLHLHPVRYHSDGDIERTLPKLDTHAGFTYIVSGVKEKGGNLDDIYARFNREVAQATESGSFGKPILPAVRTQGNGHAFEDDGTFTGDCDHKTRMVSMIDLIVIIAELMFAKPIQDYMAEAKWYAGGKDLDYGVARILVGMRSRYPFWVSLDYSSFDQSISAWLIHDAFEIILSAFSELTEGDKRLFQVIEHDFIVKDFVFGDEVIHSERGVPSGSMFTQIVDSIVNVLVINTYLKATGNTGRMIVMGDDNLVYTDRKIDVDLLSSYLKKNFGMTVNVLKTCSGRAFHHPTFLSCEWRLEGRYREPHVLISKLLYPERERKYGEGRGKPEETLWSYVLTYRIAMDQIIDIAKFLSDYPRLQKVNLREMGSQNLPGFLKYVVNYTDGYWSKRRPGAA